MAGSLPVVLAAVVGTLGPPSRPRPVLSGATLVPLVLPPLVAWSRPSVGHARLLHGVLLRPPILGTSVAVPAVLLVGLVAPDAIAVLAITSAAKSPVDSVAILALVLPPPLLVSLRGASVPATLDTAVPTGQPLQAAQTT